MKSCKQYADKIRSSTLEADPRSINAPRTFYVHNDEQIQALVSYLKRVRGERDRATVVVFAPLP